MTDSRTLGQSVPKEGLFLMDGIEGLRSLPKHSVDMLLTDPPYGTTRNYWDVPLPLPELWEAVKWAVKPNGAVLFFAQCPFDKVLGASNLAMLRYDAEKDQWYFNGEEVRYFRDVLTSNGESLTSGKFRGEMRTLGSGVGTIDIYTVRDYGHLNSEHHGTLTGIEKYSQEEFDEHTQAGISGNQSIGNASHN